MMTAALCDVSTFNKPVGFMRKAAEYFAGSTTFYQIM